MKIEIRGGRIHDPASRVNGEVRSIYIQDGKIVAAPPFPEDFQADRVMDASGRVVMPGGVDIHCHIAGAAVNRARRLTREEKAQDTAKPAGETLRGGTGGNVPSTFVTGYRYAGMGYTTAVEAAVPPGGARQCQLELADTPCIDKAFLLVLSDHPMILDSIARGDMGKVRNVIAWMLKEAGAFGIKAVNPGGSVLWRRRRGIVERLNEPLGSASLTPRKIVEALVQAANDLELPHPLHLHANRLGFPGNAKTTIETINILEGRRTHLAHLQFHSYRDSPESEKLPFRSGAQEISEALKQYPALTADVGQVCFGSAVTITADRPMEHLLWRLRGKRWVNIDGGQETGCGIGPITYRRKSLVHALQWAIGLELLLLSPDPWRVVLSTDHPNGAFFLAYPRIIAALLDRSFREEEIRRAHPLAVEGTALGEGIQREYTLNEIAIITRAGPARILGLPHKGHLGPGADADVTVYDDVSDRLRMFESPRWVIQAGHVVIEDGELRGPTAGKILRTALTPDPSVGEEIREWRRTHSTVHPSQYGLTEDELAAGG